MDVNFFLKECVDLLLFDYKLLCLQIFRLFVDHIASESACVMPVQPTECMEFLILNGLITPTFVTAWQPPRGWYTN